MGRWNPKKLSGRHKIALRLYAAGKSHSEISEATGLGYQAVVNLINSELFQECFREFQKELDLMFAEEEVSAEHQDNVRRRLAEEAENALDVVIEMMKQGSEKTRLASAFDILDRAGYKAEEVHKVAGEITLSRETESNINIAAKQLGAIPDCEEFIQGGASSGQESTAVERTCTE